MAGTASVVPEDDKRKRMRSPAYPFVNLETAIKRAKEFYKEEQRNAANVKVAARHWGYEEKSSGGLQTAAALISFGLMRDEGAGEKRKLQLTQNALRILIDERPDSVERDQAIKAAALTPKIHHELWKRFKANLPSDGQLRSILTLEWEPPFNENTVGGFIKEFRDTIRFANLSESDSVALEVIGDGEKGNYVPRIGDFVQWEPNGVLQFVEAKSITGISPDGQFAFVEGSSTGLPVGELSCEKKAEVKPDSTANHFRNPPSPNTTMKEDVFSLSEGKVVIQWPTPLSADSIQDLKDWLKIVERKIARSVKEDEGENP